MDSPPERALRVVILVDSLHLAGGAQILAVENAARLQGERFECGFCVSRWDRAAALEEPGRALLARLDATGVRVVGIARASRLSLRAWGPLMRLLREERVDVIHGHIFGSNVWAAVLGRLARVPVVVAHDHMWSRPSGWIRTFFNRWVIGRLADAFIAVSGQGRLELEREGVPARKVRLVPNGIPTPPAGDGGRVRSELGLEDGRPVIGTVGHLRPEKAHEVLVEAAARLVAEGRRLRVLIAGEGGQRPMLEGLIESRGLGDVVTLLGARKDVPDLLATLDIAVCCSDSEVGPLSVMEYMEAALPVVATDVGGIPELVDRGRTGLLVPPRDPEALARALAELLDDPASGRAMGEAGRQLRREEYGIERWAERIAALYEELAEASARSPAG